MADRSLPRAAEVVIVGGGVVGAAIAYHLARRGAREVLLLERDQLGSGATSKAAGGIRAQFGTEIEVRFSLESLAAFERFAEEFGVDPEFRRIGYLFLLGDERDLEFFRPRMALQRRLGVDVRLLAPAEARELVPALRVDDLVAAVYGPNDGYANPYAVTIGYARRAQELGVRIVEEAEVTALRLEGDRVSAVVTDRGVVATPLVVNAAGPAAARIGRMAGVEIPVLPRRRHIFFTDDFPELPGPVPLTIDRTTGFYFRKELARVLLSPGDVGAVADDRAAPVEWGLVEEAVRKAVWRVPVLERARIAGGWAGLRPLTPDEHAIIGWAPGVRGLFLAVGFCGHGFQHAPATGRLVAEWLLDGRPSLDLTLFRPDRFARPVVAGEGPQPE